MSGMSTRNHPNGHQAAVPQAADPTGMFEAFVRRIERAADNHNHGGAPPRHVEDRIVERFRHFRPEKFNGDAEPWRAEQWLREMESIFDTLGCSEIEKRRLATFQLTYAAADWWESEKAILGEDAVKAMPWNAFRELFLENYFPQTERNKKEREFIELTQGNRTVREYTVQFERLSRFAYHMIDTPEKKNRKYHQGLSLPLQCMTLGHHNQNFKALIGMAIGHEDINE